MSGRDCTDQDPCEKTVIANTLAADWVRQRSPEFSPRVGMILGSGLGSLADSIAPIAHFAYQDIPGFPQSHVSGHAGRLVLGTLSEVPVVAMQGRAHLYEGWSVAQVATPVRTMAQLGIELLIVSNASGGINPRFRSGQIVLIDRHVNLMFQNSVSNWDAHAGSAGVGSPQRTSAIYHSCWLERAEKEAIQLGFSLPRGTYLGTLGPNYETRAEYRAFASMGADMVGMSTVPETMVAAQMGIPSLAFSIITNVAKPDAPSKTEHADVLAWSQAAQNQLAPLIERLLREYFSNR
ncbi:MAG: purine-nucleoside phosphorylase [Planctomycetota bacterium]